MNPDQLLDFGTRGIHLLFDTQTIAAAFGQDVHRLREVVDGRSEELHFAVAHLVRLPTAREGRHFIEGLPLEFQHVLVLLYFDLLDNRLGPEASLH